MGFCRLEGHQTRDGWGKQAVFELNASISQKRSLGDKSTVTING